MATTRRKNVTGKATAAQTTTSGPAMRASIKRIAVPRYASYSPKGNAQSMQRKQTMISHTLGPIAPTQKRKK